MYNNVEEDITTVCTGEQENVQRATGWDVSRGNMCRALERGQMCAIELLNKVGQWRAVAWRESSLVAGHLRNGHAERALGAHARGHLKGCNIETWSSWRG